jgi:hypothetical protein
MQRPQAQREVGVAPLDTLRRPSSGDPFANAARV